ncbi:MAG: glycosyltransferase family 1 protein [Rubrobacteraceae bacterium]|nr:glycosyltransferase family 1 protein [Rubrobacteraceae bacterium]
MRIAMFTETFLPATDGVVTRLRHTVEELGGMGDEILVFAPSGGPESYAGARVYGVPGVPFPPYPEKKLCPPHPGVGRTLRSFRPDLVHAVNPVVLGAGGVYYARRYGVPLVASYHTKLTAYARHYGLGFAEWLGRAQLKALHNRATVNLCNSEADSDELLRWGVKRVRVWPHGVDSRGFRPGRASGAWRAKLSGGNPEDKILLSVGRLAPEKDLGRLKAVLEGIPGTRLAIVGDGPARRTLERAFAGTPTVFTGFLHGEELAAAYASSDVFLFPSTTDTLGLAMVEALASGVPVVASRSGASREVVDDGRSGLLYEAGCARSLVGSVRRLVAEPGTREAMGKVGRAAAERRDWGTSARALRRYYEGARRLEASCPSPARSSPTDSGAASSC